MDRRFPVMMLIGGALACGGGDGADGVLSEAAPVTLRQVQLSVFTPSCAVPTCHVGAGAPFGLDLSEGQALASLIDVASSEVPAYDRVDPFVPLDSYVYMKVIGDPRILGDPMPALPPDLSPERKQLLADWIAQGALP